MTWGAQVLHVIWKDLRQLRVLLVLYAVSLAIAVQHALSMQVDSVVLEVASPLLEIAMLLILPLGMLVVAGFIQTDSPIRSDAFWRARPLSGTSIFIAKATSVAVIVLGVAMIAQAITLAALSVPLHLSVRLVANTARIYALWLLLAMVVASVTHDLRAFIIALIAGAFVLLFLVSTFLGSQIDLDVDGELPPLLIGVLIGPVYILALYCRRYNGRLVRFGSVVPVLCVLSVLLFSIPLSANETTRETVHHAMLRVAAAHPDTTGGVNLQFDLEGGRRGDEYSFIAARVTAYVRDEIFNLKMSKDAPQFTIVPGVGLVQHMESERSIPSAIDSVAVDGQLSWRVKEPQQVMSFDHPVALEHLGRRTVLLKPDPSSQDLFTLRTTSVEQSADAGSAPSSTQDEFADVRLVNDASADTIQLHSSAHGGFAKLLLLPGARLTVGDVSYRPWPANIRGDIAHPAAQWLKGARVELRPWRVVEKYFVHDTYVTR